MHKFLFCEKIRRQIAADVPRARSGLNVKGRKCSKDEKYDVINRTTPDRARFYAKTRSRKICKSSFSEKYLMKYVTSRQVRSALLS